MRTVPENLYFRSKKVSLTILAATAVIFSRIPFVLFNDPEGPNLFVVGILTLLIFAISSVIYVFALKKMKGAERLILSVATQILLVVAVYYGLK